MPDITHIIPTKCQRNLHILSDQCKCIPLLEYNALGMMVYRHNVINVKLTRKDELLEEIKDRFN